MNPLVRKEVRLLAPGAVIAFLLAAVPVWLIPNRPGNEPAAVALFPFSVGAAIMALSSFEREFSLRTFSLLLAQPLARNRIWWTKIAVLGCAMGLLFWVWCLSCAACVLPGDDWTETLVTAAVIVIVAFAGGLWTTLLLRQVTAAFWFVILIPSAMAVAILANGGAPRIALASLSVYAVCGFWLAWRQFRHAQEVGWTGGVITLARQRKEQIAPEPVLRRRRPLAALTVKEFHLHEITLAGMGGLFLLHVGVIVLRSAAHNHFGPAIQAGLESFALIWLVVPFIVGSTSIAEERKLGTLETHLTLPISSRSQFITKLLFVLLLGGILSPILLCVLEAFGQGVASAPTALPEFPESLGIWLLLFVALSALAFYASSLTRNLLQSLALAVVTAIGYAVIWGTAMNPPNLFGFRMWQGDLFVFLGYPAIVGTWIWLAYGNFGGVSENRRLWRRNTLGLVSALALVTALTTAIYNRAWELLGPIEHPHGPSRLAAAKRPSLRVGGGNVLTVLLPDGKVWFDRFEYEPGRPLLSFGRRTLSTGGKWMGQSGNHFLTGSNWTEVVFGLATIIAIRSDGTLWFSDNRGFRANTSRAGEPPNLLQVGEETNWVRVVRDQRSMSVLLLKREGTLWRWGRHSFDSHNKWPGLRAFKPYRLGSDSDWAEIASAGGSVYAWKKNGEAWVFHPPIRRRNAPQKEVEPGEVLERWEIFDGTRWRSMTFDTGVREDGTLWVFRPQFSLTAGYSVPMYQAGKSSNWVAATSSSPKFAALREDGSLWQWEFRYSNGWILPETPRRLSVSNDWIALNNFLGGVTLAADGSLWLWGSNDDQLLRPSRKPVKVGNVLGENP